MKRKTGKYLLYIILIMFAGSVNAQVTEEWVARYNGTSNSTDAATSMSIDNSGNVYVTGYSTGSGTGQDYLTVKYNTAGVAQWVKRFNGPANSTDRAYSILVDDSGFVYVSGYSTGIGSGFDYATIKYSPSGDSLWVKRYNGPGNSQDQPVSMALDNSGNAYITGSSVGSGNSDYATVKYNSSGVQQWVQRFNGSGNLNDQALSIAVDLNGYVFVTGFISNSINDQDYCTIKYNSSGVQQWLKIYNGPVNLIDKGNSIAVDNSGNVYVTGYSDGSSSQDFATIMYNSSGGELWVKRYNGPGNGSDVAKKIIVKDSVIYVGGYGNGNGTGHDFTTIKYDLSGLELWVSKYNGPANNTDQLSSMTLDGSGNIYVTGYTGPGQEKYATVKYDPNGAEQWSVLYNGIVSNNNFAQDIKVDSSNNVYITGNSNSVSSGMDYATLKYKQSLFINLNYNLEAMYPTPDSVKVYLAESTSPFGKIDSSVVYSELISSGFKSFPFFKNAVKGSSYYIVVKHRNSIETWSGNPVQLTSDTTLYDFTSAIANAYGQNMKLVSTIPERYAFYSGDVNYNDVIDLSDIGAIYNSSSNFEIGYVITDLNGDEIVDLFDITIAQNNGNNFIAVIRPL